MASEAVRVPAAVGLNVTLIEQVALTASDAGQVFVSAKSPAFAPPRVIELMVSASLPVFLTVKLCAALTVPVFWVAKVSAAGLTVSVYAGINPVPVRLTACGDPVALSLMASEASRVPVAAGLNVTLIEQVPFTASDAGQVFVSAKSPRSAPPRAIELMVKASLPVF